MANAQRSDTAAPVLSPESCLKVDSLRKAIGETAIIDFIIKEDCENGDWIGLYLEGKEFRLQVCEYTSS